MSGHGGGGGRRKRGGGHGGGGGGHGDARFLVTYADLLTVLMALFLVLWVLATIDLNKFKKFTQGLGDFGNPAAKTVETPAEAAPGETVPTDTPNTTPTAGDTTDTTLPAAGGTTDSTDTGTGGATGTGTDLTASELQAVADKLSQDLTNAQVPASSSAVRVEARGLIVTVSTDGVLFGSGSATMTAAGKDILAALAPELRGLSNKIIIEGHTDKRPLARVGYDNWNLSADRAISVLRTMANDFGIPSSRLAATGYGEYHPVDPGDTEQAFAKNRRVEIVVLAKADTPATVTGTAAAAGDTASATTAADAPPATASAGG